MQGSVKPVAIVTGASSGIGRATALQLASHGWTVVLVARRAAELNQVKQQVMAAGGAAVTVAADLAKPADIARVVADARVVSGRIDALVNVAGIGQAHSILTDDAHVQQMIAINLLAPTRLMRAVIPIMREQRDGAVVNIGSVAGEIGVNGMYSATKFALRGLTDSVRREVAGSGIRVSLVEPGYIATPLTANRSGRMPGPDIVARAVERAIARTRRRLIVPWTYRFVVWFATTFPGIIDRVYAGRAAND
jgi:short-subunit dehydrogenase